MDEADGDDARRVPPPAAVVPSADGGAAAAPPPRRIPTRLAPRPRPPPAVTAADLLSPAASVSSFLGEDWAGPSTVDADTLLSPPPRSGVVVATALDDGSASGELMLLTSPPRWAPLLFPLPPVAR